MAFTLESVISNLYLGPHYLTAFLWLVPLAFSWQFRMNVIDNGKSLVHELRVDQSGTRVKVKPIFGKEMLFRIEDLR